MGRVTTEKGNPPAQPRILIFGLKPYELNPGMSLLKAAELIFRDAYEDDIENVLNPPPCLILSSNANADLPTSELAQFIRVHYPDVPSYYIFFEKQNFEREVLRKNGFTDGILLPLEWEHFNGIIRDALSRLLPGNLKSYRAVKLFDIKAGTVVDFDIYLFFPMNNKYIKLCARGDIIAEEKIESLHNHKYSSVFIDKNQISDFNKYVGRHLSSIGKDKFLSVTEKQARMHEAVRDVLCNILVDAGKSTTFSEGQKLAKDCHEIVKEYLINNGHGTWYDKFISMAEEKKGSFSHASNVSAYGAVFSMGLNIGKPEEVAVAGLFHDLGITELPANLQNKLESFMTVQEVQIYQKHPALGVDILKRKKINVSETVHKIILQHHEFFNGTGYPNKLLAKRILPEAQLLALADHFDELTTLKEGNPRMNPIEALQLLKKQSAQDPMKWIFDPEILKRLASLFSSNDSESMKKAAG